MIQTVLGEINENELGICSSHEHIFIDMRGCVDITGNEKEIFYDKITMSNRAEVFADPYAILDNALLEVNTNVFNFTQSKWDSYLREVKGFGFYTEK